MKNKVKKDVKTKNSELTEVMAKLNSTKEAEYHQFHQVDGGVHCVARCSTARCNSLDTRRLCTVASLGTPASSAARATWTSAKWIGTWCCAPQRKVEWFNLPTSPEYNYNTSPRSTGLSSSPTCLQGTSKEGRQFWNAQCAAKHSSTDMGWKTI